MKIENLKFIQRYFDKELEGDELIQFKKKLEEDVEFAKDVQQFAGMIIGLRASEKFKKHKTIVFGRYLAIAASIALIILIGYLTIPKKNRTYTQITNQTKDSLTNRVVNKTDSIIIEKVRPNKINYLADNYKDNSKIEGILEYNYRLLSGPAYRSWGSSAKIIRKISPKDSAIIKTNEIITFIIKDTLKGSYNILIYNNKIINVFESPLLQENTNGLSVPLPGGLYYWRIKIGNKAPWCGKFYIVD